MTKPRAYPPNTEIKLLAISWKNTPRWIMVISPLMVTIMLGKPREVWGMIDSRYQTSMAARNEISSHTLAGIRLARDFFFFVSMKPDHSFSSLHTGHRKAAGLSRFLYYLIPV